MEISTKNGRITERQAVDEIPLVEHNSPSRITADKAVYQGMVKVSARESIPPFGRRGTDFICYSSKIYHVRPTRALDECALVQMGTINCLSCLRTNSSTLVMVRERQADDSTQYGEVGMVCFDQPQTLLDPAG